MASQASARPVRGSDARTVMASPRVVRIVEGRLAGKEFMLPEHEAVHIGHGFANDMVLRGAGTRDTMLRLQCHGETATLRVLGGKAELLGRTLEEGDEAILPAYLPFRIGEFVLAYGEQGDPRWEEAARVAATPCAAPLHPLPSPSLADRLFRIGRERLSGAGRVIAAPRLALACASILLLALAAGSAATAIGERRARPESFEDRLAAEGLSGLRVTGNPAGGLIVSGIVADEGQMAALRKLAGETGIPVRIDVTPTAALADAAAEVLQAQGVRGRVEADRAMPRGLLISAAYLPVDRQEDLRALLKRDLPGLRAVTFRTDDALGDNALQAFFGSAGRGLATLVEDPGHIVTADGTRWFPGAVLPTGHRLISIGNNAVRLEKDGRVEDVHL